MTHTDYKLPVIDERVLKGFCLSKLGKLILTQICNQYDSDMGLASICFMMVEIPDGVHWSSMSEEYFLRAYRYDGIDEVDSILRWEC